MTQQLRDELARLADRATPPHVAPETWRRGRAARRRDRVVAGAAALALVVVLGGIAALVTTGPGRVSPAGPLEGPGAVPSTLHPVPTYVQTDPASYTSDLAVGTSSVAFVTGRGTPVVVSATDGSYSLLDLPGWPWADLDLSMRWLDPSSAAPLALSPDGDRLAWGYRDDTGTGIRIADLATGEVEHQPVRGAENPAPELLVTALAWSGDSDQFAWSGQTTSEPLATWYGQLTEDDVLVPGDSGPEAVTVGISDEGIPVEYTEGFLRIPSTIGVGYSDGFLTEELAGATPAAFFSPDGTRVLFGNGSLRSEVDLVSVSDERVVRLPLNPDVHPDGAYVTPLGWVDDETPVVLARTNSEPPHVALMSAPAQPGGQASYRIVTRTAPTDDSGAVASYQTVAVDLLDHPTADLAAPEWPWPVERKVWLLALSMAAVLIGAAWVTRRWFRIR